MKRPFPLAAFTCLLLAGCTDNRTSIEITGRAAPGDPTTCLFTPGGQVVLGPGILDVSYGAANSGLPAYGLAVYLTNNLTDPNIVAAGSLTSAKAFRAESARIRLNPREYVDRYGAIPALLPVTGEAILGLQGQTTPPNGSSVEVVDALSAAAGQAVLAAAPASGTQRLVFGITIQGRTLDGAGLDTAEWYYAIDVCNGCLPPPACAVQLTTGNCFFLGQDNRPVCPVQ